jgi:hypothetical protein
MPSGAALRTHVEEQFRKVLGPHIPMRIDTMVAQPGGAGPVRARHGAPRFARGDLWTACRWGIWPTPGPSRPVEPSFQQASGTA